jgi:hypothetical protein
VVPDDEPPEVPDPLLPLPEPLLPECLLRWCDELPVPEPLVLPEVPIVPDPEPPIVEPLPALLPPAGGAI